MDAKNTNQNVQETVINEGAVETDANLDEVSKDSQDDIRSFSTDDPAEVCESIDEFLSQEPPSKQQKGESVVFSQNQKRSMSDESLPLVFVCNFK